MKSTLVVFTAFAMAACGRVQDGAPTSPPSTSIATNQAARTPCPLGIYGLVLSIADVDGGVVIGFSSPPGRRDEVRARVKDASMMHGAGSHRGKGHDGGHFGSQVHGLRLATLPPSTATVEETENGADLRLVALVPDQVGGLREQARERVAVASRAPCSL